MTEHHHADLVYTDTSRTAAAALRSWLRHTLPNGSADPTVHVQPEQLRYGEPIDELTVDFTGVQLPGYQSQGVFDEPVGPTPEPVMVPIDQTAPAHIGEVSVQASPLYLDELPVSGHLLFSRLPITWVRTNEGREAWHVDLLSSAHPDRSWGRGRFQIHAPRDEAEQLFGDTVEAALQDLTLRPSHTRVRVRTSGSNTLVLRASTRVRWSLFRFTFKTVAKVRVSSKGVMRIEKLSFRGSSLILRPMLWYAKRGIPRKIKLAEELFDGMRLRNITFAAGDYLGIRGEILGPSRSRKMAAK